MSNDWIKQLKPGDLVAHGNARNGIPSYKFSKVEKVTPSGQIVLENGKRFNPDGYERVAESRYLSRLVEAKIAQQRLDEYEAMKQKQKQQHELERAIKSKLSDLSLEQLEKLSEFLETL